MASSPMLFTAAFEHGVLSAQWTFSIISCSSSLSSGYLKKTKRLSAAKGLWSLSL